MAAPPVLSLAQHTRCLQGFHSLLFLVCFCCAGDWVQVSLVVITVLQPWPCCPLNPTRDHVWSPFLSVPRVDPLFPVFISSALLSSSSVQSPRSAIGMEPRDSGLADRQPPADRAASMPSLWTDFVIHSPSLLQVCGTLYQLLAPSEILQLRSRLLRFLCNQSDLCCCTCSGLRSGVTGLLHSYGNQSSPISLDPLPIIPHT